PLDWLTRQWVQRYCPADRPGLPAFDAVRKSGRLVLLLDGLNEMPHVDAADYGRRVRQWSDALKTLVHDAPETRVVATCRSANLSEELTLGKGEPVPHVRIKDLEPAQVERFLQAYDPDRGAQVWRQLQSDPALVELYRSPYYLRMLLRAMRGR